MRLISVCISVTSYSSCEIFVLLTCLSLCNTQARAVNLIHAVLCDDEGATQLAAVKDTKQAGVWGAVCKNIISNIFSMKVLSLHIYSYLCTDLIISACRDVISGRDSYLCMQR